MVVADGDGRATLSSATHHFRLRAFHNTSFYARATSTFAPVPTTPNADMTTTTPTTLPDGAYGAGQTWRGSGTCILHWATGWRDEDFLPSPASTPNTYRHDTTTAQQLPFRRLTAWTVRSLGSFLPGTPCNHAGMAFPPAHYAILSDSPFVPLRPAGWFTYTGQLGL